MSTHPLVRRLALARERQGLTQTALAQRMGYLRVQVNKWENGHGLPNLLSLLDWCNSLGLDLVLETRDEGAAEVIHLPLRAA